MKTLVTYFSQSGNTEKIAHAIHDAATQAGDAEFKKIGEIDLVGLTGYDVIFIGAPLQRQTIPAEVIEFAVKLPRLPGTGFAGFFTHSAPAYPPQALEGMIQPLIDACEQAEMENLGVFDCQGYLADEMHGPVQEMRKLDDASWAEMAKQMAGHPNEEDMSNAADFAGFVLGL